MHSFSNNANHIVAVPAMCNSRAAEKLSNVLKTQFMYVNNHKENISGPRKWEIVRWIHKGISRNRIYI